MYAEDQEEDVEEEEEFHEVEEEKHRTSQESVGESRDRVNSTSNCTDNEHHQQNPAPAISKGNTPEHQTQSSTNNEEDNLSETTLQSATETGSKLAPQEPREELGTPSHADIPSIPRDSQSTTNVATAEESHAECPKEVTTTKISDEIFNWADIMLKGAMPDVDNTVSDILSSDKTKNANARHPETVDTDSKACNNSGTHVDDTATDAVAKHDSCVKAEEETVVKADDHAALLDSDVTPESKDDSEVNTNGNYVVNNDGNDTIDAIIKETEEKLKIDDDDPDSAQPIRGDSENPTAVGSLTQESSCQSLGGVPLVGDAINVGQESDSIKPDEGGNTIGVSLKDEENKAEEVGKKELDLDEDVKNPQYIPKKGVFYEHDDRSHDVGEKKSSPVSSKKEEDSVEVKESNKKAGGDRQDNRRSNRKQRTDADRWNHDLFKNEKQKPKSKSELINAYGYDIRHERGARNQPEGRAPRANNTSTSNDRPQPSQDGQRSRQAKDTRPPRQSQTSNQSRERKPRRQNVRGSRGETSQSSMNRRENVSSKAPKSETRDLRETINEKNAAQEAAAAAAAARRDQDVLNQNRNPRLDSRGRRRTSRDRPANDDSRLPLTNTVMPPITTWSSEDMMKAEAFGKNSPTRAQAQTTTASISSNTNSSSRDRAPELWQQNAINKSVYPDRTLRAQDEQRQQYHYNSRGRYQDRSDENHRPAQFAPRNSYNERVNQQSEWHRAGNFNSYAKPTDYVVKTQTFENSRLSQGAMNRPNNNRDLREVINDRRGHQQNFQNKVQHADHQMNHQRGSVQGHYHHQYAQSQHYNMIPHHQPMVQGQQHLLQQTHSSQQPLTNNQQHQPPQQHPQATRSHQQSPQQAQSNSSTFQQSQSNTLTHQRQPPTPQASQSNQSQNRQNLVVNNVTDNGQESAGLNLTNNNDLMNSRPIIKTDNYTNAGLSGHQPHSQPLTQHSQDHRSMAVPITQGPGAAGSHLVPAPLGANATQQQYYTSSTGSRDPAAAAAAAAALATAYHGYMPGGHSVMDPSRYHLTSQQLTDHPYMASPGQTNDVASGSVLHQQGIYTDSSNGGTLAGSGYLAPAGSTFSPNASVPVTGAGPQALPPVSFIQHAQYPPPPYTNLYTQPQHNQAPPQTGHGYPYWTYN